MGFSFKKKHNTVSSVNVTRTERGVHGLVTLGFSFEGNRFRIATGLTREQLTDDIVGEFVENALNEHAARQSDVRYPVIRDFLESYVGSASLKAAPETRKKNATHLTDLLIRSRIDPEKEDIRKLNLKIGALSLPAYWEKKYGLHHKLRQIKSIFAKGNLREFESQGIDVSCFGGFTSYVAHSPELKPFSTSDDEVERVREVCSRLKETDPELYKIYLLAFSAGLRASEIYQVRFCDLTSFSGQYFIELPFSTKGQKLKGLDHVERVGIPAPVYGLLLSFQNGDPTAPICQPEGYQRRHKRFLRFLREEAGIEDVKACHRLRKILGARLATTAGIYHAAKQLRNSNATCERHYSDLVEHRNDLGV